jgi:hypothetical protein
MRYHIAMSTSSFKSNATSKPADYVDFGSYLAACSTIVSQAYTRKRVMADCLPIIPGDPTVGLYTAASPDTAHVENPTGAIPLVVVTGLPWAEHVKYMCVLLRSTIAAIRAYCPALAPAMSTPLGRLLAALVVAVRCGVWAATNVGPSAAPHAVSKRLQHKSGKSGVYRAALAGDMSMAAWYSAYVDTEPATAATEELMHRIAFIAPVVLDMQCAELARQSSSYAVPYVQQAISRHLKAKLSREAYSMALLQRNVVWSTLRQASVHAMPVQAVGHWATDGVFHNQAHRRLLNTADEVASSRRQEASLRAAQQPEVIDYAVDMQSEADDEFTAAVRAARPRSMSDDLHTVSGESIWSDEEGDVAVAVDLPLSTRAPTTAVPSRGATPPLEMSHADAEYIRQAARAAQGMGEIAESVHVGAQENLPVEW